MAFLNLHCKLQILHAACCTPGPDCVGAVIKQFLQAMHLRTRLHANYCAMALPHPPLHRFPTSKWGPVGGVRGKAANCKQVAKCKQGMQTHCCSQQAAKLNCNGQQAANAKC
jgi:hypothetical protein